MTFNNLGMYTRLVLLFSKEYAENNKDIQDIDCVRSTAGVQYEGTSAPFYLFKVTDYFRKFRRRKNAHVRHAKGIRLDINK